MCGIFGIAAYDARVPVDVLERATLSLAHRGPDDSGTAVIRDSASEAVEIGLGNRRLSILDLSPLAHQPMQDPANGNWIAYNGEIYNFREIRKELEQAGITFVSHSDTEVLLKAYARWGEQCLTRFRGMFAFAIWDASRRRLFLARDPMGIKPLYYAEAGSYLLFSSEVRTILGTGLVPRRLDQAGLLNYLSFGSVYDPLTLVEGIHALPAGHSLVWERGKLRQSRYWDLLNTNSTDPRAMLDEPTHAGAGVAFDLQRALEEAVRMQLVSDVPVGVFLSGGIDSSALVSILSRGGITPSTFSIVFREADFSEAEHSRAIARKFETDHREIVVSQADVMAAIPAALRAMDQPTIDGINTFFVSREARAAGVKVALSGLGGDEVFAGYSTFHAVPRMERFAGLWSHVPTGARDLFASGFGALCPATDQNRKLESLIRGNGNILHPYFLSRALFTSSQREQLFPSAPLALLELSNAALLASLRQTSTLDSINRVSYLEARCYMVNTLLRDSDFMSMAHGLEVRVPLVDHELVSRVLALPGRNKIGSTPKPLLVAALENSLPGGIVNRCKRGFTLPFEHWLRAELRPEVEPVLSPDRQREGPLGAVLNPGYVQKIWDGFLHERISWSRPWALYVLHRWCELHSLTV